MSIDKEMRGYLQMYAQSQTIRCRNIIGILCAFGCGWLFTPLIGQILLIPFGLNGTLYNILAGPLLAFIVSLRAYIVMKRESRRRTDFVGNLTVGFGIVLLCYFIILLPFIVVWIAYLLQVVLQRWLT